MPIPNTSRHAFLSLPEEDKMGLLFDWMQSVSNTQARNVKERIKLEEEINYVKGEVAGIGRRKETTSEKIRLELSKQNVLWVWFRDKVLPGTLSAILTIVTLAVLYEAFGGKIP